MIKLCWQISSSISNDESVHWGAEKTAPGSLAVWVGEVDSEICLSPSSVTMLPQYSPAFLIHSIISAVSSLLFVPTSAGNGGNFGRDSYYCKTLVGRSVFLLDPTIRGKLESRGKVIRDLGDGSPQRVQGQSLWWGLWIYVWKKHWRRLRLKTWPGGPSI